MKVLAKNILDTVFLGNYLWRYIVAFIILLVGNLFIKVVVRRIIDWLEKLSSKTTFTLDDFLVSLFKSTGVPLMHILVVYLAINSLTLTEVLKKLLGYFILGLGLYFGVKVLVSFVSYAFKLYLKKQGEDISLERSLAGILILIKVLAWALAVIFFLDNLGFKISAVIAGLGIGGVAVALAAQAILKDLFSYFCIIFDHPFRVGDFVIVDDYMGTIEYIGIKTTRIRSLSGEMLIISNSDLTDSRLRNYKLMEKRRVVFRIGVVYNTPLSRLKEIPKIIQDIITNIPETVFDRAHFFSFGDYNLIFEVVYYVLGADYKKYMGVQQEINFSIMEEFTKRNIEF
ncbi:MAG: mechanosensitive ion channel family protein, partial [Candidatus Omnitrophica bacterium]|nr:mechanosensitive ion channel family protein [Candidatus Omnitrophota bacterium]